MIGIRGKTDRWLANLWPDDLQLAKLRRAVPHNTLPSSLAPSIVFLTPMLQDGALRDEVPANRHVPK